MKIDRQRVSLILKEYKQVVVTLILLVIFGDILLIKFKSDLVTFTILGLLIISFKFYNFPFKRIFILCFIPIIAIFLEFIIDPASLEIEKAAIWLFLLLGTGIVWQFLNKKENETT